jgi:heme A synthase
LTCVVTYGLIVLGAIVRATGSGLGCPDWPLCHGRIIPPFEREVLIEYSHRLTAALVTPLVVASAVVARLRYRRSPIISRATMLAVGLLVVQIVLGGITVLLHLPETIVTVHLGVALTLLATLLTAAVATFVRPAGGDAAPRVATSVTGPALVAAAGTFVLLLSGALVRGSNASLACLDWPLCNGQLVPTGDHFAAIHFLHRLIALTVGGILVWLLVRSYQSKPVDPTVRGLATAAFVIYVVQVLVGAANVWGKLPVELVAAHVALASALWACLVIMAAIAYLLRRPNDDWIGASRRAGQDGRDNRAGMKERGAS